MSNIELIKENLLLKSQLLDLTKQISELNEQLKIIKSERDNLLKLSPNEFTMSQFVTSYLTNKFTIKTMPKKSGIYAYFNRKTSQLYVGQSVNMGNRLIQHFRNGKIKISGHDSEFVNSDDWEFYVLEYIHRDDKQKLDDREAYWIAMAKVASSQKTLIDKSAITKYEKSLKSGKRGNDLEISKMTKREGVVTNRTRGNNVRM